MLITGASRGIGAAIARRYAREGALVALVARSHTWPSHAGLEGTLDEVARDVEALGGTPLPLRADLRDADEELAFWALSLAERDVLTSKRSLGTISSKTDRSGTSASK